MIVFASAVLAWFDVYGRKHLPWQEEISPYKVWISEIMLQQTQVVTVIPYYKKFIQSFPDVKTLAEAKIDEVLHHWTGLGYYARARNLHKGANQIIQYFDSPFPDTLTDLMSVPGIGRSTAGAILSIAFNKPTPILDGNVKRVLMRFHAIEGALNDKKVEQKLWQLATEYTPIKRCGDYTQAIMDLGATLCTRTKPKCHSCPLQTSCLSFKLGQPTSFPQAKIKKILPVKNTQFLIVYNEKNEVFLQRRPATGLWGGLWSFPEYDGNDFKYFCEFHLNTELISFKRGKPFRHTFTHFHLDIQPVFINIKTRGLTFHDSDSLWHTINPLPPVGLAAPVKRLIESTANMHYLGNQL